MTFSFVKWHTEELIMKGKLWIEILNKIIITKNHASNHYDNCLLPKTMPLELPYAVESFLNLFTVIGIDFAVSIVKLIYL